MFSAFHSNKSLQLVIGLGIGFLFGILLQKGNVTEYDVIVGQLLFRDFTVVKIMVTAIVTGMVGVHILRELGLAQLHPKPGSLGMTLVGGLIFGVGFAVPGYCPGTIAAAVVAVVLAPQGMAYALLAGLPPIVGLYAATAPLLAYALVGSSRHLAVGPVAMVSLLVHVACSKVAQPGSSAYLAAALQLALLTGLVQLLLGAVRAGFMVNFLSRAATGGFTSAAGRLAVKVWEDGRLPFLAAGCYGIANMNRAEGSPWKRLKSGEARYGSFIMPFYFERGSK